MEQRPGTALVLVGHGSTTNPDSSQPTRLLADTIRSLGIFDEVSSCFWKEEPSMREVLHGIVSPVVYIVPHFISEGYFTRTVIPREFALDGPVTIRGGKRLFSCDPAGSHSSMTQLLIRRARETAPAAPKGQTSLIIVGHGTTLDANSAAAARIQADRIAKDSGYAEVLSCYMEEDPLVSQWASLTTFPHVVVLPFFISDGLHSYQDIPVLLGIRHEAGPAASDSEIFKENPHHLRGKSLYYGGAIGTDPGMKQVILDLVEAFDQNHGGISTRTKA